MFRLSACDRTMPTRLSQRKTQKRDLLSVYAMICMGKSVRNGAR
jgi:hypothetical protein